MRLFLILIPILGLSSAVPQRNLYLEQNDRPAPGQIQAYVKFSPSDIRNLKTKGYALPLATASPNQISTGYRSTASPVDNSPAPTQRRPVYEDENYPQYNSIQVPQRQQQQQQQQRRPPQNRHQLEQDPKLRPLEEEEEKEEPDRLTLLLPNSKFECAGKVTGYYADEGLECEVFHYCQDNTKHSWICPEGFTFHQVHLICMPPAGDNICSTSSQYHFVNDYLYKPLNEEEHLNKPNVTLRYSDRYYPDSYYPTEEQDDEQHQQQQQQAPRRQPIQVGFQKPVQQLIPVTRSRPQQPTHFAPTIRPETHFIRPQIQHGQVFHSPEEVNISLQQRRPLVLTQQRVYQQADYQ